MRLSRAIDLYIDDLALRKRSRRTRDGYERLLFDFARLIDPHSERVVAEIGEDDCRRFLGRWRDGSPSTLASGVSLLRGFFRFLERKGEIARSPMFNIERPARQRAEDLDVVTVSDGDVIRLINACRDFQELICLGAAAYLGRRRTALANARRADADLEEGFVRFTDKGGKVIVQPIPAEYLDVLREADIHGVWDGPLDWLIPPRRKCITGTARRESKVIYETVQKVAARAGVRAHVHALRAAFAVRFDQAHPEHVTALKELMGHSRIETTMVYLRRKDKAKAMDLVRDLSWSSEGPSRFEPRSEKSADLQAKAHTGFEPVIGETRAVDPLRAKLNEIRERAQVERERERERAR
jgi:integrase